MAKSRRDLVLLKIAGIPRASHNLQHLQIVSRIVAILPAKRNAMVWMEPNGQTTPDHKSTLK